MKLGELTQSTGKADIDITGLTADSRKVKPGFLFAALPGTQADGAQFIDAALTQGAAAILAEPHVVAELSKAQTGAGAVLIADPLPRRALAEFAARFYRFHPEMIVGVTGTNGKTSVANFVRQIWTHRHLNAASMGTLGIAYPGGTMPLHHTTPDPVEIHQALNQLAQKGVTHLALEASSHGLAQYRLDGLRFQAAGFTNLSQDHLDYHHNLHDYFHCKARLFTDLLKPDGLAVINMGSSYAVRLEDICRDHKRRILKVGHQESLGTEDVKYSDHRATLHGQTATVRYRGKSYALTVPLVGDFQLSNVLVAAGLAIGSGLEPADVFEAIGHLVGVPGRLQWVGNIPSGGAVYVDYAHTPDGIETVLKALRKHVQGKLHIVFGAGGDRDRAKRPLMGKAADRLADCVYVTDDNPRSEDPASIREAILEAVPRANEIAGRGEAIAMAIGAMEAGDILVVAGKGHETGQIVGDKVIPFDDAQEILSCLKTLQPEAQ